MPSRVGMGAGDERGGTAACLAAGGREMDSTTVSGREAEVRWDHRMNGRVKGMWPLPGKKYSCLPPPPARLVIRWTAAPVFPFQQSPPSRASQAHRAGYGVIAFSGAAIPHRG